MSIEMMLYLVDFLSNVDVFFLTIGLVLIVFTVWTIGNSYGPKDDKCCMKILFVSMVFLLLSIFIPSKKTMYLMIGASSIKQVSANNNEVYQKTMLVINKKLDEYLKEDKK